MFDGPEGKTVMFTNANSWYIKTLVLNLINRKRPRNN